MNKAAILEEYKGFNREDLIEKLLITRASLRIEKAQSKWLDVLADELRDDEGADESAELFKEYEDLQKRLRKELSEKYDIEL